MKIKLIEKIKTFFENRKLKKMSDEALIEKLEEKIEERNTGEILNIIEYVEDDNTQMKMAKDLVESRDINQKTKEELVINLPHETKEELFRKSIKTKEILAQKDINSYLKILIKNKKLQPYDELYDRLDKAFSDSQLANILGKIQEERPENYDKEKVLRIIAKQIVVNIKKYQIFLPSHLEELTNNIRIKNGEEERKFDILREEDRKNLFRAIEEEAENLKKSKKNLLNKEEEQRVEPEKLKMQMERMVQFAKVRQEEVQAQNLGKDDRG